MKTRTITALAVCLMAFGQFQCGGNQASDNRPRQPSDFKTWTITSSERGGIDGRDRSFSVTSVGTIKFEDRKNKASAETRTENAESLGQLVDLLKRLDLPNTDKKSTDKRTAGSDQVNSYFVVKLDERDYYPGELNMSESQSSDYQRLLSMYRAIRDKNETALMNRAAELKVQDAKTLTISVSDAKYKPAWEGKFSKRGEGNVFAGEWKNNETAEVVKDEVEILLNGQTVKILRKGANELQVPKEFARILDPYNPGMLTERPSANKISWVARFE